MFIIIHQIIHKLLSTLPSNLFIYLLKQITSQYFLHIFFITSNLSIHSLKSSLNPNTSLKMSMICVINFLKLKVRKPQIIVLQNYLPSSI